MTNSSTAAQPDPYVLAHNAVVAETDKWPTLLQVALKMDELRPKPAPITESKRFLAEQSLVSMAINQPGDVTVEQIIRQGGITPEMLVREDLQYILMAAAHAEVMGMPPGIDSVWEILSQQNAPVAMQWLVGITGLPAKEKDLPYWCSLIREAYEQRQRQQPKVENPLASLSLDEMLAQKPPLYLVRGLIPERSFGVVYGGPGTGKTFAMIDLAFAIAQGLDWHGLRTTQGIVVYIASEGMLQNRLAAYVQHHGLDKLPPNLRFIQAGINLLDPNASLPNLHRELARIRSEVGPIALVVVDTLNRAMAGGDENSSTDMGLMVARGLSLIDRFGCAFTYVHHSGKNVEAGARGHSSLKGAVDFELQTDGTGEIRILKAAKIKDDAGERDLFSFRLKPIDLGPASRFDPDADPDERRTSCVLEVLGAEQTPAAAKNTMKPRDRYIFAVLADLVQTEGKLPTAAVLNAVDGPRPSQKVVSQTALRAHLMRGFPNENGDTWETSEATRKDTVNRRLRILKSQQLLGDWDGWTWKIEK